MDNFREIRDAIGDLDAPEEVDETRDRLRSEEKITITTSDPIEIMRTQIIKLTAEIAETKASVNEITSMLKTLAIDAPSSKRRNKMRVVDTPSTASPHRYSNATPSESVDTDGEENVDVSTVSNRSPIVNPFSHPAGGATTTVFKSNSATASKGYVGKHTVWGTALASFLTGATRYYIAKKDVHSIMIDEVFLMTRCNAIVNTMYEIAQHRELPGVRDPCTLYLSSVLSRMSKDDVPTSNAKDWVEMSKFQDGRDVVTVINNLIMVLKLVPESIPHPVSRVVSALIPPTVRLHDGNAVFAMYADLKLTVSPNQWERLCLFLKKDALVKYVKYRVSGMSEPEVTAKMMAEMRASDLIEKRNMEKFDELFPYSFRHAGRS